MAVIRPSLGRKAGFGSLRTHRRTCGSPLPPPSPTSRYLERTAAGGIHRIHSEGAAAGGIRTPSSLLTPDRMTPDWTRSGQDFLTRRRKAGTQLESRCGHEVPLDSPVNTSLRWQRFPAMVRVHLYSRATRWASQASRGARLGGSDACGITTALCCRVPEGEATGRGSYLAAITNQALSSSAWCALAALVRRSTPRTCGARDPYSNAQPFDLSSSGAGVASDRKSEED